jgi:hypothetical protein
MSYFRTKAGVKVTYESIAEAVKARCPELRGRHIFEQLEGLGMLDDLMKGESPCGLPYSFSDYERK